MSYAHILATITFKSLKMAREVGGCIKMFYSLTVMHLMFFLISGVGHLGLVTLSRTISSEQLLMLLFEK